MNENIDEQVVAGFGDEWSRFDQSELSGEELGRMFDNYFNIFPWETLPENAVGFDLGCGSGHWAKLVAPRVGRLHLIETTVFTRCEPTRSTVSEIAWKSVLQKTKCAR